MPYHLLLDHEGEAKLGELKIGTTKRGIGPCYADKADRLGIRVQDLLDEKILRKKIITAMEPKRQQLRPWAKDPSLDLHTMVDEFAELRSPPRAAHRRDLADRVQRDRRPARKSSSRARRARCSTSTTAPIPFVTSSNPIAGAACVGAGVGPTMIDDVWGIAKAYTTRVGSGPFPSEIDDEVGDRIREVGGEFGTTTGRARRIGWLDLVALKYATRLNGLTGLCVTKLDVLSGIETLRVATSYSNSDGAVFDEFPYHQSVLHHSKAEYVDLPGWDEDITGARSLEDLPEACRNYLDFISEFLDVPIVLIGVGPERSQIILSGDRAAELRATSAALLRRRRAPDSRTRAAACTALTCQPGAGGGGGAGAAAWAAAEPAAERRCVLRKRRACSRRTAGLATPAAPAGSRCPGRSPACAHHA